MNRFIAFSALLAVVAAEAEPWYGLGYGYGLLHKPVITSVGALTTYSNGAVTPTNTPAVAAATAQHLATKFGAYAPVIHPLGKRSADAEADPWYGVYGYGYAPVTHPVTSVGGLTTYANGAVVPTDVNNLAATHAHLASKGLGLAYHTLGKREAEAEPWYGLYGHGLYGYAGVHPYSAGLGCHNAYGAPVPCAGRKKREAEAEADPYLYYPAYPGVTSVGALTTYSNGAVVPTDLANQAATAAHLGATYPRAHGYGVYGLGLWG